MREVSVASKSPRHKLAKALNKLFEPYTGQTRTAIKEESSLYNSSRKEDLMGNFYVVVTQSHYIQAQ